MSKWCHIMAAVVGLFVGVQTVEAQNPNVLFDKLDAAKAKKDWPRALELMKKLQKSVPPRMWRDSWETHVHILKNLKDYDAIMKVLVWRGTRKEVDEDTLNDIAWTVTEHKELYPILPDARKFAERACKLTDNKESAFFDTLARVTFCMGDKDKAVELQKQAIAIDEEAGKKEYLEEMKETLRSYEKGILPPASDEEDAVTQ